MGEVDWLEYARQQKPNSKWRITLLTNVAFHVYPMEDRPIGRGEKGKLPKWLIENRGLDVLEKHKNTGKLYADNLCYFRCLARSCEARVKRVYPGGVFHPSKTIFEKISKKKASPFHKS